MRIVFAGTPEFAAGHLRFLLDDDSHTVVGIFTQPDRPAGRGKQLTASPVKLLAENHGLKIFQPSTLRDTNSLKTLAELKPDLIVVVAYGLIVPGTVLSLPRFGCINVHASLLPRWRGAAPIQRAIEAGDTETGITVMQMNEGLDTGDLLLKISCLINSAETTETLHDKLLALGGPALLSVLRQIDSHTLTPEKQDDAYACYAKKITKSEAKINWAQPTATLETKIRAFNPAPIAFFNLDGDAVRIWRAEISQRLSTNLTPGTIIEVNKKGITVSTGDGALTLLELQLPGRKSLPVSEMINALDNRFAAGRVLS